MNKIIILTSLMCCSCVPLSPPVPQKSVEHHTQIKTEIRGFIRSNYAFSPHIGLKIVSDQISLELDVIGLSDREWEMIDFAKDKNIQLNVRGVEYIVHDFSKRERHILKVEAVVN